MAKRNGLFFEPITTSDKGNRSARVSAQFTRTTQMRRGPSRAQPRPVCNLPNDLSPGLIITVVPSPTKQSGGILFKNNCVPSCDGFLCLITANCSEFTSIMARLTRRLCNTGECGGKKIEREMSSRRQLQFLCALVERKIRDSWRESTSFRVFTRTCAGTGSLLFSLRLKRVNFASVISFYIFQISIIDWKRGEEIRVRM